MVKAFRDGTRNDQLSFYCREGGRGEGRREKGKGSGRDSRIEGKENSAENKNGATLPPGVHYLENVSYHSDQ